ncbi:MAG: pilus assembly protein TapA [Gammaproteobacteria bacterium CG11_big_fil_rev_8_21_14_0_20_46_22]|nr:MAG: pilus assembly protein TapA [Gammaproteobacteria bacterium CG12_big_fil_rev_8_21_14_0_65_46_12]PIR11245.1 MAG: pilus assembly protein TapA [Gammaproteobacteria bacterium CG11_big_fil_rev_8_21_14_0_20_46_22]
MNARGFTLMELMIVMAIVSILAAIALPTYQYYTHRARFTGVLVACEPYRAAVALALQEGTEMSAINNGENGVPDSPSSNQNIKSIIVSQGVITATASKAAGSYTYTLTPDANGADFSVGGTCLNAGLCKP